MSFIAVQSRFLPYQGVKILPKPIAEDCGPLNAFCQIVEQNDALNFQFQAWETDELLTDGNFDELSVISVWILDIWRLFSNNYISIGAQNQTAIAIQQSILTASSYYKIVIDYTLIGNCEMQINESPAGIADRSLVKLYRNTSGTIRTTDTFYFVATTTNVILNGEVFAASSEIRVHSISVVQIATPSNYTIHALDLDGATQGTLPAADISQIGQTLIVQSLWDSLSLAAGCYQLRVTSAYSIFEDTFATDQGWIFSNTSITIGSGVMSAILGGFAYIDVLEIGATYQISYDVVNYVKGTVKLQAGNTNGTGRVANGTYVETLECTGWGRLLFAFIAGAPGVDLDIDNIVITKTGNIDGWSECFDLSASHDCSKLLKWSNDENIMDFDYTNNYQHSMRVKARFDGVRYPTDRLNGLTSGGVSSVAYAALRKVKILDLDYAREWVHDAIAIAFMHDNSQVDSVEFGTEDDYEPETPNEGKAGYKYRGLIKGRLELSEKAQNLINRNG